MRDVKICWRPMVGIGGRRGRQRAVLAVTATAFTSAALAFAANEYQINPWNALDPRLKASLIVPYEDATLAGLSLGPASASSGMSSASNRPMRMASPQRSSRMRREPALAVYPSLKTK